MSTSRIPSSTETPPPGRAPAEPDPRILIAGLGNLLMTDDGVGVHAAHMLAGDPPHDCLVVEIGAALLRALHLLESSDHVIVIDAMEAGGEPGTIYGMEASEADDQGLPFSLHELGLAKVLSMLEGDRMPQVHVIGVEPGAIGLGLDLTPRVREALPEVCRQVRILAASLTTTSTSHT